MTTALNRLIPSVIAHVIILILLEQIVRLHRITGLQNPLGKRIKSVLYKINTDFRALFEVQRDFIGSKATVLYTIDHRNDFVLLSTTLIGSTNHSKG